MRIGVIGLPGRESSERLAAALEERTGFRLLIDFREVVLDLGRSSARWRDVDLRSLDGLVIKKIGPADSPHLLDRLEILSHLARGGLRIFSHPERIARAINRLSCTLELARAGIPVPATVVTESAAAAAEAVDRYGTGVCKPLLTSKARGMDLVRRGPSAAAEIEEFRERNPVLYVQEKVEIPGKDLGIVFLGGEYLGTYARVRGGGSWNTTTYFGGRYARHEPEDGLIELAHRAQSAFGLDFTCVDVAETPAGPVVFEVSAFGGFRGLRETSGIDAAALYADYVIDRLGGRGAA